MTSTADIEAKARKSSGRHDSDDLADQIATIRTEVQNLTGTVGRMARGQVHKAQSAAIDQVEKAQDTIYETALEAEGAIRRNPLSAMAIAVGLGFLFGVFTRR